MNMKKKIFKTVESTLKAAEINYHVDDDIVFRFRIKGDHANFDVRMICEEDMEILMAIVTCGLCVPKDKIDRMCRWVTEKNYTLTLGEFKMDTSDGELSFRLGCPLDGGTVNEEIAGVVLSVTINSFDNAYEEIVKAMYIDKPEDDDWMLKMARETAQQIHDTYVALENGADKRTLN